MVRLNAVEERMLESIRDHLAVPLYRPTQENALRIWGMCYYQLSTEQRSESRQRTECSAESLTKLRGPMSFN